MYIELLLNSIEDSYVNKIVHSMLIGNRYLAMITELNQFTTLASDFEVHECYKHNTLKGSNDLASINEKLKEIVKEQISYFNQIPDSNVRDIMLGDFIEELAR